MARLFYDPNKLNDEQREQLKQIAEVCAISEDEEIGLNVSEYFKSGQYRKDIDQEIGKKL